MKRGTFLLVAGLLLTLAGVTVPAVAAPISSLDFLEVLEGPAKAETRDTWVYITFEAQGRTFRVEAADLKGPVDFQTAASKILSWDGHLILLDQERNKAWHFWVPEADQRDKGVPGAWPETEGLKALLADYEVTRIAANAIATRIYEPEYRGLPPLGHEAQRHPR